MWYYIINEANEIISETRSVPAPGLWVERQARFNQAKEFWAPASSQFINRQMLNLSALVDGQTVEIAEEGDEITFEAEAVSQETNQVLTDYNETVIVRVFPEGSPSLKLRLVFTNGLASKTLQLSSGSYVISAKESLDSQEMYLPLDVTLVITL